ncbi:EamA family transporter [Spirillospora sp. CA-294931]|uniref:EamA family transporter n=1 Tax=Spirillospora sp. CA-294931 TaxID=3240042 RepID=UPI003D90BEA3
METVVLLALAAAAFYGASDFYGGLLSRSAHYTRVGFVGQAAAASGALLAAIVLGSPFPGGSTLLWGLGAGLGGALGTLALYRGLAQGRMNIAGPLSAVGAAGVPVLVDLLFGERLTLLAVLGVLVAIPGIWLVSSQTGPSDGGGIREGLLAGLGFAGLFVCLDRAGDSSGLWPVAVGQVAAVLVLGVVVLRTAVEAGTSRPSWKAAVPGVLGVSATILYFLAAREGTLAVAAVITSLFPAFTVALAAIVLRERTTVTHGAGLALCAVAVGAFAAG